ncbi:MAG: GNAT family N-acetyltransferase [Methylotenera sp.]|nr:MAG: GNAT family N-acetyltransferase [Methylotenera sp.]
MVQHPLHYVFAPKSVAVFGASDNTDSVGEIVFQNMLQSGFRGSLYPINPKHSEIQGCKAYSSIAYITEPVELAVITTPALSVPDIIEECGEHHVKAAIIISAGFSESGPEGKALEQKVLEIAQHYGIRLIGPNCLGVMCPRIGLNATFNKGSAISGNLSFVSQSGALCTAILDWANSDEVGFSSVISLGASLDVDFGEILDYLISDEKTHSILLYIEGIRNVRTFMSAIRAAARIKPVILVKVGRHAASSKAAMSHTASLVGSDDAFEAAVRRAGVVRVDTITQLFSAAKALSSGFDATGNRLAIVTNGGGPGVIATDIAIDLGLVLATLSENTIEKLNQSLPPIWSHGNPVDIIGDAQADRYQHAVKACLEDPNVDGVLTISTPQAMTKPLEAANIVIELSRLFNKPLIASWMGGAQVETSRAAFKQAKKLCFRTPEQAVEVFSFLYAYHKNQKLLMQVPGPLTDHLEPDIAGARTVIDSALQEGRSLLNEMESKAVLAAFHIPVAQTIAANSVHEALLIAQQMGFPIAMKVNSAQISHKTDVKGVKLNIGNAQSLIEAYHEIIANAQYYCPDAHLDGVAIEPMILKPNGRELMIGVTNDPVFGPIITFGAGGTNVEVMNDRSVALPPHTFLVKDLVQNTRVAKMLVAFRNMPPVNMDALESVLLRVSEMVCELPMLMEMDINPLILDENGALAVDARVVVTFRQPSEDRYAHMAIHPYPSHLVSNWQLPDGTNLLIRPIRPEDALLEQAFIRNLSEESRYFRFMENVKDPSDSMLIRFTQIDYVREMALIAVKEEFGKEIGLGVARYAINPDGESCDFGLVVAENVRGKGLGYKLMTTLMDTARSKGLKVMGGEILKSNARMLELMHSLNFDIRSNLDDDNIKMVRKAL